MKTRRERLLLMLLIVLCIYGREEFVHTKGNVSSYAYGYTETYTVTYDANGGSGAPNSQTKIYGEDLQLSSTIPTRSGYTFNGWSKEQSGTIEDYEPGEIYTEDANMALYAVWDQMTYTVIYNANGGSSGSTPSSQTKVYGVDLQLSLRKPIKNMYSFKGWSEVQSATTWEYEPGAMYTEDANITLYAVWGDYTLTYDANGGEGAPNSQTKVYGKDLKISSTIPTKSGYEFMGWGVSSTMTYTQYPPGSYFKTNGDVKLYALWGEPGKITTITYNANGGTNTPCTQKKIYGTSVNLALEKPTRTGYIFVGWSQDPNSKTVDYKHQEIYRKDEDVTLYAVWSKYAINYYGNGGTGSPPIQPKFEGEPAEIKSTIPTRSGYVFNGWSRDQSATTPEYVAGDMYTEEANITLYAIWTKVYTVTYDANGGEGAPSSQTKVSGVSLQLSSTEPTREGYVFNGWSRENSATTAEYASETAYTEDSDITLYAVWSQVQTYTVTYDANGGEGAPSSQIKVSGVSLQLSSTIPTRKGYIFNGWSRENSATTAEYASETVYTEDSDITLYAVWSKKHKIKYDASEAPIIKEQTSYTVKYDTNGGSRAPSSQTKIYGEILQLSSTEPTRKGYIFNGWSREKSGKTAEYATGSAYTEDANITLYAVWTKSYTITYDANGGEGTPSSQTKVAEVSLQLSSTIPTRSGYVFNGWNREKSATTAEYVSGEAYTEDFDITLYAVWSQAETTTYTVTYDANGGEGAPNSQTKVAEVSLQLSSTIPTRSEYIFNGWSREKSGITVEYGSGAAYTENSNISLYAVWEKEEAADITRLIKTGGIKSFWTILKMMKSWRIR